MSRDKCNQCGVELDGPVETATNCDSCQAANERRDQERIGEKNELDDSVDSRLQRIATLMPPKFLADDPDFNREYRYMKDAEKVFLPDPSGGVQAVESNFVTIQYKGNRVRLRVLPKHIKRRRQLVINLISILLGLCILAVCFYYLF